MLSYIAADVTFAALVFIVECLDLDNATAPPCTKAAAPALAEGNDT